MQNNYSNFIGRTKINVEGAAEEEETVKNYLTFLDFSQNSKWKGNNRKQRRLSIGKRIKWNVRPEDRIPNIWKQVFETQQSIHSKKHQFAKDKLLGVCSKLRGKEWDL